MCRKMFRVQQTVYWSLQTHYDCVRAECSRLASATDSVTEHWKRPRPESHSQSCAVNKNQKPRFAVNSLDEENHFQRAPKRQPTSSTTTLVEPNTDSGILDELAERLGNFHESARALVDCLQTRNVNRKPDQCMIETAKCMFHKLLGEASDDLDRVTLQSREDLRTHTEYTSMFSYRDSERKTLFSRRDAGRKILFAPRDSKRSVSFSFRERSVLRVDRWSKLQMAIFKSNFS